MSKIVGVIGGLGPMATVKFMEFVIKHTKALKDQDNVDMLVCQYGTIPDRTAYILNKSTENPLPLMLKAARQLDNENVDFIVIPCNTATYFYDEIVQEINIPVVNVVAETISEVRKSGYKKVGIMATDGTIKTKIYEQNNSDFAIFYPDEIIQKEIMSIIYDEIKQNKFPDQKRFSSVLAYFKENGCDAVISACTEISVALDELNIDLESNHILDSLQILAKVTIERAGKIYK